MKSVVPRLCYKPCDWLLNSPWDHFGLCQGTKCQSGHGVRGLLERHVFRSTLSTDTVQWDLRHERPKRCFSRRKRQGPMAEKYYYNDFFFSGKRRWKQEKIKKSSNSIFYFLFFQKCPFWGIYLKNQHIQFFVHGHSSWRKFVLHLVRDPKTMEVGPREEKKHHLPWSDFMMIHGVNWPFIFVSVGVGSCHVHLQADTRNMSFLVFSCMRSMADMLNLC